MVRQDLLVQKVKTKLPLGEITLIHTKSGFKITDFLLILIQAIEEHQAYQEPKGTWERGDHVDRLVCPR